MRLRITAAAAVGVLLIGILAWPLAAPSDPLGAVFFGTLTIGRVMALAVLALLVGLIGYFASWPFGREIAVLSVPAGLGVWALRSGTVADLLQQFQPHDLAQRQALYAESGRICNRQSPPQSAAYTSMVQLRWLARS
jgi:Zn-dependent protease with chaperone function